MQESLEDAFCAPAMWAVVYLKEVALVSLETTCLGSKAHCLASFAATVCPSLMGWGQ